MSSRSSSRWLALAMRARQWTLDERGAALQQARDQEESAIRQQQRVDASLVAAHAERNALLSREQFGAVDLGQFSAFELGLRAKSASARQDVECRSAATQSIRDEMQQVLAERDAYGHRNEVALQSARRERERASMREIDELWLLQQPATGMRNCNED